MRGVPRETSRSGHRCGTCAPSARPGRGCESRERCGRPFARFWHPLRVPGNAFCAIDVACCSETPPPRCAGISRSCCAGRGRLGACSPCSNDSERGRAAAGAPTTSNAAAMPAEMPLQAARSTVLVKRWLVIGVKACGPASVHVKETGKEKRAGPWARPQGALNTAPAYNPTGCAASWTQSPGWRSVRIVYRWPSSRYVTR